MSWKDPIRKDFLLEVQKGNIPGHEAIVVVGASAFIGTTEKTLWDDNSDFVWPTGDETWEILSDNVNDALGGTGANVVLIIGLDANFVRQIEFIEMDGTSTVPLTRIDWNRIELAQVVFSGSSEENEGTITLRVSGAGNVRATVLPGLGFSNNCFFTIPSNKYGFSNRTTGIPPKGIDFTLNFRVRLDGTNAWVSFGRFPIYQTYLPFEQIWGRLPPKTDIEIKVSSTNTTVFGGATIEYLEVDLNQINPSLL